MPGFRVADKVFFLTGQQLKIKQIILKICKIQPVIFALWPKIWMETRHAHENRKEKILRLEFTALPCVHCETLLCHTKYAALFLCVPGVFARHNPHPLCDLY
jgi:uncharacterized membrane protein